MAVKIKSGAGTPPAGTGDAGTGDGTEGDGDDGGEWSPTKESIAALVDQKVNGAMSNHLTRFRSSFGKDMETSFGNLLKPLSDQFAELKAAPPPGKKPGKGEEGGELSDSVKELLAKSEGRIKELEEKNRQESAARTEERAARFRDEERTALANVLRAAGVDELRLKPAVALLYTEDKRVARTEDGKIVMKVQKAGFVDDVSLDEGVASFLKTEEGKVFLPPDRAPLAAGPPTGKRAASPPKRSTGCSLPSSWAFCRGAASKDRLIGKGLDSGPLPGSPYGHHVALYYRGERTLRCRA
jgi:hypothetical protein